ncbi:MAG: FkbM family methyltransferase, partial [Acidobacteriota bacterium]
GGKLIVVPSEVTRDPALFLEMLAVQGVTVLNQTPAAFYSLAREALTGPRRDLALRYVIFGGEALHPVQLREWRVVYPEIALVNMYGITETTVHVTFKEIGAAEIEGNIGNIGRPIPTTTTYVMDSRLRLLPVGVPGEICVGGGGVGRGYLNRDDLTAEKFIENPYRAGERLYRSGDLARFRPNGEMVYIGRLDDQVQIRGFRVELGEIQDRLLSHPLIADAIVVARDGGAETVELIAYILPKAGAVASQSATAENADGRARRYRLPNGMEVFHLNRNETDFLYQEIFAEASYLKHGVTLRDGDCVFDVGANIGLFTLFAGQACRDARIFSFEPIPATFDVLRKNSELYGLNVKLFECGLGRERREEVFTSYPYVSIFSGRFAVPEEEQKIIKSFVMHQQEASLSALESAEIDEVLAERMGTQQVVCQLRTLSDVIREEQVERIDLLKIDVEKSELDLLAGIDDDDWAKIEQIVMEVHNVDQRLEGIRAQMESHGFEVTVDQDDWFSDTSNHNLYAVKPARKSSTTGNGFHQEGLVPRAIGGELISDLRDHLRQSLPDYMIPSAFVMLDAVPRTANGKVDYKALPAPDEVTRAGERVLVAPRTPLETQVLDIWRNVLGVEHIGVHDSFFEVGGHSLLATQVISRLRDAVAITLPVRVLFESPTIAGLAEAIEKAGAQQQHDGPALVRLSREAQSRSSVGLRSKADS